VWETYLLTLKFIVLTQTDSVRATLDIRAYLCFSTLIIAINIAHHLAYWTLVYRTNCLWISSWLKTQRKVKPLAAMNKSINCVICADVPLRQLTVITSLKERKVLSYGVEAALRSVMILLRLLIALFAVMSLNLQPTGSWWRRLTSQTNVRPVAWQTEKKCGLPSKELLDKKKARLKVKSYNHN